MTTVARCWFAALAVTSLLASTLVLHAADNDYVAHEWGTFTSIQGGDGVLLDWNGVATSDLPPFVYDWKNAGLVPLMTYADKGGMSALQRMETPVIYFYSKQPATVDVTVKFPRGRMTEWYPKATDVGPSMSTNSDRATIPESLIRWKNVVVNPSGTDGIAPWLPTSAKPSHYFAARETDASFIRVEAPGCYVTHETEKFLFYRGVGNFQTPLKVTVSEQGEAVTVLNTGGQPLKHLFAVAIHGDRATVVSLGNLATNETRATRMDNSTDSLPAGNAVESLRIQMAGALMAEGLYRAEAEAMVNTWRDAWFEDQGVRILYVLPRKWTDATLPITMNPQPRELVRVMVGRAEVITPAMEQLLCKCVEGFRQSDPAAKQAAINEFKAMKLGRFAQVALRLAGSRTKDTKFFEYGASLIEAAAKSESTSASTSQPARRLPATGG